jgi:hypothetical protein
MTPSHAPAPRNGVRPPSRQVHVVDKWGHVFTLELCKLRFNPSMHRLRPRLPKASPPIPFFLSNLSAFTDSFAAIGILHIRIDGLLHFYCLRFAPGRCTAHRTSDEKGVIRWIFLPTLPASGKRSWTRFPPGWKGSTECCRTWPWPSWWSGRPGWSPGRRRASSGGRWSASPSRNSFAGWLSPWSAWERSSPA